MASKSDGSIYSKLKQDHREVQQIIQEMLDSKETQVARREELFHTLKQNLLAHAHAEQQLLYTELERHKPSHEIAIEAEEEHLLVEHLIDDIEQCDVKDEHWHAKVMVLQEVLQHHIQEEEKEMFRTAHKVLDKEFEHDLAQRFETQKQQEMRQL